MPTPRKAPTLKKVTVGKSGQAVARYKGGAASWLGPTSTNVGGVESQLVALGRAKNGYDQFGYVPAGGGGAGTQVSGATPYAGAGMKTAGRITPTGWKPTGRTKEVQGMLSKAMGKHKRLGDRAITDPSFTSTAGTSMQDVTDASIASSAQSQYAEGDLSRTGTAAAQGKAYEAMFGTDAGTVLHAESVPSIAQTAADSAASAGSTSPTKGGKKGHKGGKNTKGPRGVKGGPKSHARTNTRGRNSQGGKPKKK